MLLFIFCMILLQLLNTIPHQHPIPLLISVDEYLSVVGKGNTNEYDLRQYYEHEIVGISAYSDTLIVLLKPSLNMVCPRQDLAYTIEDIVKVASPISWKLIIDDMSCIHNAVEFLSLKGDTLTVSLCRTEIDYRIDSQRCRYMYHRPDGILDKYIIKM